MSILIKLSGKIIDEEPSLNSFISDLKKICLTNKIVVVHGGGKQITNWMKKMSVEPKFVNGLRYTDKQTLDIVSAVLCGLVNKYLVFKLASNNINSVGISCVDGELLQTNIDDKLGFVGKDIKKINTNLIETLWKQKYVVLVSSLALGKNGRNITPVNVNADNVAFALSKELNIKKTFFLTDKEGVLDKNGQVIKVIKLVDIPKLISSGVVTEGMIPKLNSISNLLKKTRCEVIITNNLKNTGTKIVK